MTTELVRDGRPVSLETLVRLGVPLQGLDLDDVRVEAFNATATGERDPALQGRARAAALTLLALRDVHLVLLLALLVDVSRSLGAGTLLLGFAVLLQVLVAPTVGFGLSARVRRPHLIARVGVGLGVGLVVVLVLTALASSVGALVLLSVVAGLLAGAIEPLVAPLAAGDQDGSDAARARLAHLWASRAAGSGIALVVAGLLAGPLGLSWRGAVLAVASIAAVAVAVGAPALLTQTNTPTARRAADTGTTTLGTFERVRRLSLIPSARRAMTAGGTLGLVAGTATVYALALLERRAHLGIGARAGVLGVAILVGTAVAVAILDRRLRQRAGGLAAALDDGKWVLAAALPLVLVVAFVADGPYVAIPIAAVFASVVLAGALTTMVAFEVAPRAFRRTVVALTASFFGPVGVFGGLVLVSGLDRRFGASVAFASVAVPLALLARTMRAWGDELAIDVERKHTALCDEAERLAHVRLGRRVPMLACRSIDFSYGQLQVLFGVDFTVNEGEMLALLGTNGAGKSTLLRVISGLGLPQGGRLHFAGEDITFLDPERRVGKGIVQIPGGKAVFGPMSVIDNLRVFGHALGRSSAELDAGIEATLAAFPRLEERRNQLASTLSGGEQQMLALGKALIIRPRLLLIDELSLGLAPIIVGQLLDMVRRINQQGTAVVLVEQSVNVALSLVDHAYFMEKGQIRFDGKASELMERRDLLRSVFLEGVGAADE